MSPPRLARDGSAFDRGLVRAARAESPPDGAEDRALAALGLAGHPALDPSGQEGLSSAARAALGLKTVGVGVAMMLGGLVAAVSMRSRPLPALAPDAPVATQVAAGGVDRETLATVVSGPSATATIVPSAGATSAPTVRALRTRPSAGLAEARSPERVVEAARAAVAERPPLSAEIALVQQAMRALASGEVGVALSVLDTYRRECPQGVLAKEAGVLRVQALARSGNTAEARRLARELLDADPRGVLAPRLRAVLGEDSSPDRSGSR
jgi:hypothetical protein